jgi:hypothetical protein
VKVNPANGEVVATVGLPFDVHPSHGGLALDPATGNLWVGSGSGPEVAEVNPATGTVLRRVSLAPQGVGGQISGLAFDDAGNLLVSSVTGVVYRTAVTPIEPPPPPTITGITALAPDGVPADPARASANAGQVITILGADFRMGDLQVLFPTRNEAGVDGVEAVAPLAVSDAGSVAQVRVPDLASTGDVRVAAIGSQDLGFGNGGDAIHRGITLDFTPTSDTVALRFLDGGLQTFGDETWGLDNVRVTRGAVAVFQDDFEADGKPEWAVNATDGTLPGVLTRFSGRFASAAQTLTLTGLTAGQTHTLTFDLYILDSWEGLGPGGGPDVFLILADEQVLFREAFSNVQTAAQTFGGPGSIPLQIVPTITDVTGGALGGLVAELG